MPVHHLYEKSGRLSDLDDCGYLLISMLSPSQRSSVSTVIVWQLRHRRTQKSLSIQFEGVVPC